METNKKIIVPKKLKATNVFQRNYNSTKRIVVNQGGTGSSKTYSIAQLFITLGFELEKKRFSIVRKVMPSLRATAMRDFFTILKDMNLYDEKFHNKSMGTYHIKSNEYEFFGLDEPQKVRSRRRDYLWLNEGNEMSLESFRQLNMRTSEKIFIDFNPSDEFHWIYEDVLTRPEAQLIKSTYLDNPFLPEEIIHEIERYKDIDKNYWNIYGLGERGVSSVRIYTNFEMVDELPSGDVIYGLDFGYNNPTALVKVVIKDQVIYVKELIYESQLTNTDLITKMKDLNVDYREYIYADSEDPQRIKEISLAGFNVKGVKKNPGSVKLGIDLIKRNKFYITKDSANLLKEVKNYSWKTKDDLVLDDPVKVNDHAVDAIRYAVYERMFNQAPIYKQITSKGQYPSISEGI